MSKFGLILTDNVNFDYVLIKILKKERHFLHTVFCKDFESAIRLTNFQFWKFDLIWQYDLRNVAVVDGNIDLRPFLAADLDSWGQNWYSIGWTVKSQNFDLILRFFNVPACTTFCVCLFCHSVFHLFLRGIGKAK